jgi:hypothetical protein
MQTKNMKVVSVQSTDFPNVPVSISVKILSNQQSNTANAAAEFENLQFVLQNSSSQFAGMLMNVTPSLSVANGYSVPISNSPVATICGIVIPVSVTIIVLILYFVFSNKNMDLPGSNYVAEPLLPDSDRPGVEMKSI